MVQFFQFWHRVTLFTVMLFICTLLVSEAANAAYSYSVVGSSISTTGGTSIWSVKMKMVVSINADNTISATATKLDGSMFSNTFGNWIYLQKDNSGASATYNLASARAQNTFSVTLVSQRSLDTMGANWVNNQMKVYMRFENLAGGWIWVGPVNIQRTLQVTYTPYPAPFINGTSNVSKTAQNFSWQSSSANNITPHYRIVVGTALNFPGFNDTSSNSSSCTSGNGRASLLRRDSQ